MTGRMKVLLRKVEYRINEPGNWTVEGRAVQRDYRRRWHVAGLGWFPTFTRCLEAIVDAKEGA